jgi:hypothetical protein
MRQLLPLLACPAMMAVMMLMMRRGGRQPVDPETAKLREEAAELRRRLDQHASSKDAATR